MAGLQKVTRIDRRDIPFDACLLPTQEGFRVEVCKYHSPGRQTFSIAHEIGHTFLIELEPKLGGARREINIAAFSSANSGLVERLCDAAAAELIWPTHVFQRDAWSSGVSMEAVVNLANQYKASVTATARRFAEVGPWRCAFVFWERVVDTGRTVALRPKGVYRSSCAPLAGRDKLVAGEGPHIHRALECNHIVKGRQTLDGTGRQFYVETMKLGQGAMSMIIMEPHAEILAAKRSRPAQASLFR
jgi:hypothetical protein